MLRTYIVYLSILFGTVHGSLSWPLEIVWSGIEKSVISPGEVVTARYVISNPDSLPAKALALLDIPEDWWSTASTSEPFVIPANGRTVRLIALRPSSTTPSGSYEIILRLFMDQDQVACTSDTLTVGVSPVARIEARVENLPQVVIAGSTYEFDLVLSNKGNSDLALIVKLGLDGNQVASPSRFELQLGRSETRKLKINVATDRALRRRTDALIVVDITGKGVNDTHVSLCRTGRVEIVPKVTMGRDPYRRIPSRFSMLLAADRHSVAYQLLASGAGDIIDGGRLEFLIRQPDIEEVGRFTSRDRLLAEFEAGPVRVTLGDKEYTLTPLTERFNYARGAELALNLNSLSLKSLYSQRRWEPSPAREFGTNLVWRRSGIELGGTFVRKWIDSADSSRAQDAVSFQGKLSTTSGTDLVVEYAISPDKSGSERKKSSERLYLRSTLPKGIRYSFEWIRAGPRFAGYYRDVRYCFGALRLPLSSHAQARLYYRAYARNLDKSQSSNTADRENQLTIGVSANPYQHLRLGIDFDAFWRKDVLEQPSFDFAEHSMRMTLSFTSEKWALNVGSEYGQYRDFLKATSRRLERYSASIFLRPSPGHSYSVYGRTGHTRYTGEPTRYSNLGISASWQIRNRLSLGVDYLYNHNRSKGSASYETIGCRLNANIWCGHTLSLRAHVVRGDSHNGDQVSGVVVYTMRMNVPVGTKISLGSIRGRVVVETDGGRRPASGVIVLANDHVSVTDDSGRFEFPSIEPGDYLVTLDDRSHEPGLTTRQELPIRVILSPGQEFELEICLVRECSITGRVTLTCELPSPKTSGGWLRNYAPSRDATDFNLDQIIVEVRSDKQVLRRRLTPRGRFDFRHLRPGRWQVTLICDSLPACYTLEQELQRVELNPGEQATLTFRILPALRPIKIIDTGEIRSSGQ